MLIWLRRLLTALVLVALAYGLTRLYIRYSYLYFINSDTANVLIAAREMNRGNWLLRHWNAGTVSYYTSDILTFALALRFLPYNADTLHRFYPAIYTFLVAMCVYLGGRRGPGRWNLVGGIVTFVTVAFPAFPQGRTMFLGPAHSVTFPWIIAGLLCLDFTPVSRGIETAATSGVSARAASDRVPFLRLAGALFFLSLGLFGDQLVLYSALAPLAIVSLLRLRAGTAYRRREWAILGVCLGAEVVSKALTLLIRHLHGFRLPQNVGNLNAGTIDFSALGYNLGLTLHSLLLNYSADVFGLRIGRGIVQPALALAGAAALGFVLWRASVALALSQRFSPSVRPSASAAAAPSSAATTPATAAAAVVPPAGIARSGEPDRIAMVLCVGILINLLTYTFTNLTVDLLTIRYLLTLFLYAGILAGRYGVPLWREIPNPAARREWALLFGAGAVSWMGLFAYLTVKHYAPIPPTPAANLATWLRDHNLRRGFGSYWASAIMDVESREQVQVGPLANDDGLLTPYDVISDDRWYEPQGQNFVVIEHPTWGLVDEPLVVKTFGPPAQRYTEYGFTVLVYDHDISPALARSTAEAKARDAAVAAGK